MFNLSDINAWFKNPLNLKIPKIVGLWQVYEEVQQRVGPVRQGTQHLSVQDYFLIFFRKHSRRLDVLITVNHLIVIYWLSENLLYRGLNYILASSDNGI